jgi:hypothetical protein
MFTLFWLLLALLFTGLIASDEPLKGSKNISANSISVLKSKPDGIHDNPNPYGHRPIIRNNSIYVSIPLTISLLRSRLYTLNIAHWLFTSLPMAFLKAYQVSIVAITSIFVTPK